MPHSDHKVSKTKRELIMAAAVDLLLANGYERTSMDAVAAKAGVSKMTVMRISPTSFGFSTLSWPKRLQTSRSTLAASSAGPPVADPEEQLTIALIEVVKAASAPQLPADFA